MKEIRISVPALVLVAGTRAILGIGAGLLLSDRLSKDQRKAAGWAMFLVGTLITIPLAFEVFGDCVAEPSQRLNELNKLATKS
jgi:hypothetical protein